MLDSSWHGIDRIKSRIATNLEPESRFRALVRAPQAIVIAG